MNKNINRFIRSPVFGAVVTGSLIVSGLGFPPTLFSSTTAYAALAGIRVPTDGCFWESFDWDELQSAEQNAWAVLGWNEDNWDLADLPAPPSDSKDWDELSGGQRGALIDLGFTQETWEESDC